MSLLREKIRHNDIIEWEKYYVCQQCVTVRYVPEGLEDLICPGGSPNDQIRYRKHSMTDKECIDPPPPHIARSNLFSIQSPFVYFYLLLVI